MDEQKNDFLAALFPPKNTLVRCIYLWPRLLLFVVNDASKKTYLTHTIT